MATRSQYGPYANRKSVEKDALKLRDLMCSDAFVTATANCKYQAWVADHPGDRPPAGFRVVGEFRYVPPLPPETYARERLLELLESLDYEVNHNPAPESDGGMSADGLASLIREALDRGLIEVVRGAK